MNEYKYLINMLYRLFGVEVSSDISEDKLNWNIILYQATLHRVTSVLFWNLQKTKKASTINNNIYKMLKSQYEYNSYRDKYCIKTASELTKKFKQNSFKSDFVFLKGPILSIYLDPGFSYRVYSDLDVLMKKESLSNAKKTLSNLGYKQGKIDKNTDEFIEATRTEIIAHEFGSHETVEFYQIFDDSINNIIVDINYSLFWKKNSQEDLFPPINIESFFKNHIYYTKNDESIIGPTPEQVFIQTCLHLYSEAVLFCWQYSWYKNWGDLELVKFIDIGLFLNKKLDYRLVLDLIREYQVEEAFDFVITQFKEIFPLFKLPRELEIFIKNVNDVNYYFTTLGEKKYWSSSIAERLFEQQSRVLDVYKNTNLGDLYAKKS